MIHYEAMAPAGGAPAGVAPAGDAPAAVAEAAAAGADEITGFVECTRIEQVTHDVMSFEFRLGTGGRFAFEPGQYVTFRFPALGLERCYTISSPATEHDRFEITVKRQPGGVVSSYLHTELAVGDVVGADGPYGIFSTARHPADKQLFLSGGSGITPMLSMARTLLRRPPDPPLDLVFVHSARTPSDIIRRTELEAMAPRPGVTVAVVCSRGSPEEPWDRIRGRISSDVLAGLVPDLAERETFLCGPKGYMESMRRILAGLGADPARVHEESFVFAGARGAGSPPTGDPAGVAVSRHPAGASAPAEPSASRAEPSASPADAPVQVTGDEAGASAAGFAVEFRGLGRTVRCDEDTTVLEAAQDAGVPLPSSCEEGVCGTCKSWLVSGDVDMDHAGGIRPREIKEGKVLLCCSTPLSDLVIERLEPGA
ncbi:hybrid-cluster NAD(P)-dependent oxidoreductase [Brevibacterium daeguense]|uniref:Hybrid-cluster NAD(P)-dependent oxidoreductase n=1 Tax=Brevibacterium daeguense TaxID=909936 RepID=A0ABP8EHS8_9MICO|nr:hybrid-cluster NAD(P)-dependent oxidoreductase [Brevibacterium daeguense]